MLETALLVVGLLFPAGQLLPGEQPLPAEQIPPAEQGDANATSAPAAERPTAIVATVNRQGISAGDVNAFLALRGIPLPASEAMRQTAVSELIDRELIRQFLLSRKTEATADQQHAAVEVAKERLRATGHDPERFLQSVGVDQERLKREVSLPIAWRHHVLRTITEDQIRDHFRKHQKWYDGTTIRVSHLFIPFAAAEPKKDESGQPVAPQTISQLQELKSQIDAGTVSFAELAKGHSKAPSAEQGGDVGLVHPAGDLPEPVANAAFQLDVGQVSEPVISSLGGHLVTVTEIQPGETPLEDVRSLIIGELSRQMWNETVANSRKTAEIKRIGDR